MERPNEETKGEPEVTEQLEALDLDGAATQKMSAAQKKKLKKKQKKESEV